ncbi:MAG: peptidylprolyl isomerase [Flavobacteriales bacterium]|nr:peptidylprolyl isomerase [Flavobacteriales bacterium]|tara:strand:- start:1521 stop:2015 length:495 start_codon:yes stop_codon:yes gene_type:complete
MNETKNKVISLEYKLYRHDAKGEMIESTEGNPPLVFLSGLNQMIPEFEAQVLELNAGDSFSFSIKSENAYGTKTDDAIIELPHDMFMKEDKFVKEVVVDNMIPLQDQNGQVVPAKVVSINETTITVDVNHPLADQDLHFSGKIVKVREATLEELKQGHVQSSGS